MALLVFFIYIGIERNRLWERIKMETRIFTSKELEGIQKRFDLYCKKTISNSIRNQIRGYLRYCSHYKTVPIEEWAEFSEGKSDEYLLEKTEIKVGRESIFLESYFLAEAIEKLPDRKKTVLLFTVALDYPIREVALELNITKKTATDYKYQALKQLRREAEKYGK